MKFPYQQAGERTHPDHISMSNKQRNTEARFIHRPIATGQVLGTRELPADIEAAITGIFTIIFGVDLLPPCNPTAL